MFTARLVEGSAGNGLIALGMLATMTGRGDLEAIETFKAKLATPGSLSERDRWHCVHQVSKRG